MVDPRAGFQVINDAYALGAGALDSSIAPCDDVFYATDPDRVERPFAVARAGHVGYRGTLIPTHDKLTEWIGNFDIFPTETEYGRIARGCWNLFASIRTRSGRPLSTYADWVKHGHSKGAGLAAVDSVKFGSPHVLWACPNWFGLEFGERFAKTTGFVFAEAGDLVPLSPIPFPFLNPRLGPVTHLVPLGSGDLLYHHAFSTYVASYLAQFPLQLAA